jgi:hypothetical protein
MKNMSDTEARKPYGRGWKKTEEAYGTTTWEHRSGAWATSSREGDACYVGTDVDHEEFVKKAFGMHKAVRSPYSEGKVMLSV